MPNYARFLSASLLAASAVFAADNPAPMVKQTKANYELAAQWTPAKMGKLVFDISVTPHWLEQGDRFWYSFENSKGRKFYIVDPVKKTSTFVFDPVKLAAQLTSRHRPALRIAAPAHHHHPIRQERHHHPVRAQCAEGCRDPRREEDRHRIADHRPMAANGNGNGNDNEPQQQRPRRARRAPAPGRNEKPSLSNTNWPPAS